MLVPNQLKHFVHSIHPNDAGFARDATRLAAKMS
jgi:hypothetical protein